MDNEKIQDLLLKLLEDISYIKATVDSIKAQELGSRLDSVEAQNSDHERTIRSLEHRANELEKFVRENMNDGRKQQTSVFISMGLAVFSAIISFVINMF